MAAALVLAAAALGWWWQAGRPGSRQPAPSVLLVTVDTLRADALGAYGNTAALTPWMDRLAASGVLFEAAHAHNVVTLASHANILSGRYPLDHGVRDNQGFRFPATVDTLATLLQARGYRTAAFVSGFPLAARFGLGRGFELYDDSFVGARARPAFFEQERSGPQTVALARRWLEATRGAPSFCWVHLFEPHYPYQPPPPFAARFRDRPYDGEVAAADAALGPLLEPVLAAGRRGRTLVVLTADHGESLGEHGEATHGIFAYEATLRVPLLLYQPTRLAPRRVAAAVRHIDLLPTVLDALSLPVPRGLPGRSLLAVATGKETGDSDGSYFEALSGRLNRGWAPLHGVIRGGSKYVDLPIPELYELGSDPGETRNLAPSDGARVGEMRALLSSLRSGERPLVRQAEDADTRERLRALGYLGAAAPEPERYTEADDPKRLMVLDAMLQQVLGAYLAGDLQGALARCRELVSLRPRMAVSLLELAHLERESGHLEAAVQALSRALDVDPHDTVTAALLGAYLTQAGRPQAAVAVLRPYARAAAPDLEVLTTLALALGRLGRTGEALVQLGRARQLEPGNAMLLVEVGTVRLMARDDKAAREAFAQALVLNPDTARAHSSLAFIAAEAGQTQEALAHWRKALALDPREQSSLVALVGHLRRHGRAQEAQVYLEQAGR